MGSCCCWPGTRSPRNVGHLLVFGLDAEIDHRGRTETGDLRRGRLRGVGSRSPRTRSRRGGAYPSLSSARIHGSALEECASCGIELWSLSHRRGLAVAHPRARCFRPAGTPTWPGSMARQGEHFARGQLGRCDCPAGAGDGGPMPTRAGIRIGRRVLSPMPHESILPSSCGRTCFSTSRRRLSWEPDRSCGVRGPPRRALLPRSRRVSLPRLGFDFHARGSDGQAALRGVSSSITPSRWSLSASAPRPVHCSDLLRNGRPIAERRGLTLEHVIGRPGRVSRGGAYLSDGRTEGSPDRLQSDLHPITVPIGRARPDESSAAATASSASSGRGGSAIHL